MTNSVTLSMVCLALAIVGCSKTSFTATGNKAPQTSSDADSSRNQDPVPPAGENTSTVTNTQSSIDTGTSILTGTGVETGSHTGTGITTSTPTSVDVVIPKSCTLASGKTIASGASDSRTMYSTSTVAFGSTCVSEIQNQVCNDGVPGAWSGTFSFPSCTILPSPTRQTQVSMPFSSAPGAFPFHFEGSATVRMLRITHTTYSRGDNGTVNWILKDFAGHVCNLSIPFPATLNWDLASRCPQLTADLSSLQYVSSINDRGNYGIVYVDASIKSEYSDCVQINTAAPTKCIRSE